MSILIKDLDHMIGDLLDDVDLLNLTCVSKYYSKVYDDSFYKRRFFLKYQIKTESKKDYYLCKKYIESDDHVLSIKFAIENDRDDVLKLIFTRNNYSNRTIYGWTNKKKEFIVPIHYAIVKDNLKCFNYLYSLEPKYECCLENALAYDAHKIINVLKNLATIKDLFYVFEHFCEECFYLLDFSDKDSIISALYIYTYNYEKSILMNEYSRSFHLFIKTIEYNKILEYKNKAVAKNRLDIAKLLTLYSSPLSKYANF